MTDDQPRRAGADLTAAPVPPAGELRMVAPLADDEEEGGDPVCWAHLVCEECGAITTEGHRAGCSLGGPASLPVIYCGRPQ
ncbi:MAG: hypothetical protein ACRDOI_09430 [Trebonia sp.]